MRAVLTVCVLLAAVLGPPAAAGQVVDHSTAAAVADMRREFAAAQALRKQGRNAEAGQTYENAVTRLLSDEVLLHGDGCGSGAGTCTWMDPCAVWARLRARGLATPAARAVLNTITAYRAARQDDRARRVAVATRRWAPTCLARAHTLTASGAPCVLAREAELLLRIALPVARALAAQLAPPDAAAAAAQCAAVTASLALLAADSPERVGSVPPASFAVETALVAASFLPPPSRRSLLALLALRTGSPPRPAAASTLCARARAAPARALASFTLARALGGAGGGTGAGNRERHKEAETHYASLWLARHTLATLPLPPTLICDALRHWARVRAASHGADAGARLLQASLAAASARCPEAGVDLAMMLADAGEARRASPYLINASEAQEEGGRPFAALGTALRAALVVDPAPLSVAHATLWRGRLLTAARCALLAMQAAPAPAGAGDGTDAPLTEFLSAFGAGLPHFARYYHGGPVATVNRAAADVAGEVIRLVGDPVLRPSLPRLPPAAGAGPRPRALLDEGARVCRARGGRHPACAVLGKGGNTSPLRIAVVSAHLRPHSVARFVLPLLEALARALPPRVSLHVVQVAAVQPRYPPRGGGTAADESRFLDTLRAALAARGGQSALHEALGGTSSAVDALRLVSRLRPHVVLLPDLGMDAVTWLAAASSPAAVTAATWGHPTTSGHRSVDAFVIPSPHLVAMGDLAVPSPSFSEPVAALAAPGAAAVMCPAPAPSRVAAWIRGHRTAAAAARARLHLNRHAPLLACLQAPAKVSPPFAAALGAALAAAERACARARVPAPVLLLLLAGPSAGEHALAQAIDAASGRARAPAAGAARLAPLLEALHAAWAATRLGAASEEVAGAATAAAWPGPRLEENNVPGGVSAAHHPAAGSAAAAVRRCVGGVGAGEEEEGTGAGGGQTRPGHCSPWHWLAAAHARRAAGRGGSPSCAEARRVVAVAVPWHEVRQRLRVLPRQPRERFEALLFAADVLLDSFPVSGGVTTLDALARGAPVVTLPAAQSTLRFTRAFLASAGLADWVAPSHAAFVQRTARLAAFPKVRCAPPPRPVAHQNRFPQKSLTPRPVGSCAVPSA